MNDPVQSGLLQYGAVGLLAVIALLVAAKLFQRLEEAYKKEVERADRLENELRDLNKLVAEQLAANLVRATEVMREVLEIVKDRRR